MNIMFLKRFSRENMDIRSNQELLNSIWLNYTKLHPINSDEIEQLFSSLSDIMNVISKKREISFFVR